MPPVDLEAFHARHVAWIDRAPAGPIHCLPEGSIGRLARTSRNQPPVLDHTAIRAERDLLALCRRTNSVGFDGPRPIAYPYLTPPLAIPPPEDYPQLPWLRTHRVALEQAVALAGRANDRLKGYAGWLVTEPPFLEAVTGLEARWRSLPDRVRPGFPLGPAPTTAVAPAGSSPAPPEASAFAADFASFCGRWGLVGMATWHLPLPQGPLLPSPLGGGQAPIAEGVHLFLPAHYPLAGDDDLLSMILAEQKALARRLGLDESVAGLPHHRIYARMLEVSHHEATIAARYGGPSQPQDFIQQIIEALAEGLGQSVDNVRRLRKEISACRRGLRDTLPRLRPRS